jgi:3-oxoacyl-[acyl-carrier protein] reductase
VLDVGDAQGLAEWVRTAGDAIRLNPTGHMGTPEEVAAAVVFLASPRASRISGANLVVDGALTRSVQL